MKKYALIVNVVSYVIISLFLGTAVVTSFLSGYPWTLACYDCLACSGACPLDIDPRGFVTAALSNDPGLYIPAGNLRLKLSEAAAVDPAMVVVLGGKREKASAAVSRGWDPDREVTVHTIRVKDVAKYCFLCGNCDKACPIKLPIGKIIRELRDNGKFKR
jgi:Fe-S oxidoreductase